MHTTLILLVSAASLAILVLLIIINFKNQKKFEEQLNNDYHKTKNHERDLEIN